MFFVSSILVLFSSYCFLSVLNQKYKTERFPAFLYLLLLAFCQLILSFEIMSLFKIISTWGVFLFNLIFLGLSVFFLKKTKASFYKFELKKALSSILSALKKDKLLMFLAICFCCFGVAELIVAMFAPVRFGDALNYYFPRCTMWVQQGSISHYITPDTRELIMPVNTEFLYTWFLMLKKSEIGIAIFSYIGFLGGIYVIFNLLKELGFSLRRSFWSILAFSAFALVGIEAVTPCSDLVVGTLILSSIYLFLISTKHNDKLALVFSAVSYAAALGAKTTAFMCLPAVVVLFGVICVVYYKKQNIKNLFKFLLYLAVFFVVFSAYNYILNYLQFSNFITDEPQRLIHEHRGGMKGCLCNFIRYIFVGLDTSGINTIIDFNGFATSLLAAVFQLLGESVESYTSDYFVKAFYFTPYLSIQNSALGILGLFVFVPSIIKSICRLFKKQKSRKTLILGAFAFAFLLNILILSSIMVFSGDNIRYLLTFVVVSAPVIAYSYLRKGKSFCKILVCFFMFIYLVVNPISVLFKQKDGVTRFSKLPVEEFQVYDFMKEREKANIALIIPQDRMPVYYIEKLRLIGYKADKLLLENIEEYNLSKYKYIITSKIDIVSTYIVKNPGDKFMISKCSYYDKNQNLLDEYSSATAVMNDCEPVCGFFASKGFKVIYNGYQYVIFQSKDTLK